MQPQADRMVSFFSFACYIVTLLPCKAPHPAGTIDRSRDRGCEGGFDSLGRDMQYVYAGSSNFCPRKTLVTY